jgi:uncharacterized low-complexity protein
VCEQEETIRKATTRQNESIFAEALVMSGKGFLQRSGSSRCGPSRCGARSRSKQPDVGSGGCGSVPLSYMSDGLKLMIVPW